MATSNNLVNMVRKLDLKRVPRLELIYAIRQAFKCDNYPDIEYFRAGMIADLILAGVGRLGHTNIIQKPTPPPTEGKQA